MEPTAKFDLSRAARRWTASLRPFHAFRREDRQELRSHLLDRTEALMEVGVSPERAFAEAVHELGDLGALAGEYRRVNIRYARWRRTRSAVVSLLTNLLFSKRLIAFGLLFVVVTFSSLFEPKSSRRSEPKLPARTNAPPVIVPPRP